MHEEGLEGAEHHEHDHEDEGHRGERAPMPVTVVFKCEFCDARPDDETQRALEAQLQELLFGTYLDAGPQRWLVWHGGGLYGRTRYACGNHRGELKATLREHYGTIGPHPWAMGPHPVRSTGGGAAESASASARLGGSTRASARRSRRGEAAARPPPARG